MIRFLEDYGELVVKLSIMGAVLWSAVCVGLWIERGCPR
jgi:hypothetical protein